MAQTGAHRSLSAAHLLHTPAPLPRVRRLMRVRHAVYCAPCFVPLYCSAQLPGCPCRPTGPERVDFLYEAPSTDKTEYLLGKPIDIKPEESDVKLVHALSLSLTLILNTHTRKMGHARFVCLSYRPRVSSLNKSWQVEHLPGSNFLVGQNNLSTASNEEFNKVPTRCQDALCVGDSPHAPITSPPTCCPTALLTRSALQMNNDPLVMMRFEEQKALQRILHNPIKMKQIRGAVRSLCFPLLCTCALPMLPSLLCRCALPMLPSLLCSCALPMLPSFELPLPVWGSLPAHRRT